MRLKRHDNRRAIRQARGGDKLGDQRRVPAMHPVKIPDGHDGGTPGYRTMKAAKNPHGQGNQMNRKISGLYSLAQEVSLRDIQVQFSFNFYAPYSSL
jgi:hypothetical protein